MRKTEDGKIEPYWPTACKQRFVDGSVASDLPMKRLAELFNVNTFIVSQVNPHVCPFVSVDTGSISNANIVNRFLRMLKGLAGNYIYYYMLQSHAMGILPNYFFGLLDMVT